MVLEQGVVVDVDDPGIRDRLVLRVLRPDIVAIDDRVDVLVFDQSICSGHDLFGGLAAGVLEMRM